MEGFRDARVGGRGPQPAFRDADWSQIREAIYEGRGNRLGQTRTSAAFPACLQGIYCRTDPINMLIFDDAGRFGYPRFSIEAPASAEGPGN